MWTHKERAYLISRHNTENVGSVHYICNVCFEMMMVGFLHILTFICLYNELTNEQEEKLGSLFTVNIITAVLFHEEKNL